LTTPNWEIEEIFTVRGRKDFGAITGLELGVFAGVGYSIGFKKVGGLSGFVVVLFVAFYALCSLIFIVKFYSAINGL